MYKQLRVDWELLLGLCRRFFHGFQNPEMVPIEVLDPRITSTLLHEPSWGPSSVTLWCPVLLRTSVSILTLRSTSEFNMSPTFSTVWSECDVERSPEKFWSSVSTLTSHLVPALNYILKHGIGQSFPQDLGTRFPKRQTKFNQATLFFETRHLEIAQGFEVATIRTVEGPTSISRGTGWLP